MLDRARHLDPGGDAELEADVAQVRLDRLGAEEEVAGDLALRLASMTRSAISSSRFVSDAMPLSPGLDGSRPNRS